MPLKKLDVATKAVNVLKDPIFLQERSEVLVKPSEHSWILRVVSGFFDDMRGAVELEAIKDHQLDIRPGVTDTMFFSWLIIQGNAKVM